MNQTLKAEAAESDFRPPKLVAFCQGIGAVAAVIGGIILVAGIVTAFDPHVTGQGEAFTFGTGLLLAGLLWFAIAEVIQLLARIAHNTRR